MSSRFLDEHEYKSWAKSSRRKKFFAISKVMTTFFSRSERRTDRVFLCFLQASCHGIKGIKVSVQNQREIVQCKTKSALMHIEV